MSDNAPASTETQALVAEFEHQGVTYSIRHERAADRPDCFPAWILFRGDQLVAELPMREVMEGYTPREHDLLGTATDVLVGLEPFFSDAGVVDWMALTLYAAKGGRLNGATTLLLAKYHKDEDQRREKLFREHEQLTSTIPWPSGFSLGMWAGLGSHRTVRYDHRAECGARAVTELDAQIAALVEFRNRLAEMVQPTTTKPTD